MVCLRLTVADLSRVRFISTLGEEFETRFAEIRFAEQHQDAFTEWRRKVKRRSRRATPREDFHALAIAPFWNRIRNLLELERETWGRTVLSGGVESVLNNLHPAITWEAPHLRVDTAQDTRDLELTGAGLVLAPSLFAPHPFLLPPDSGWQGLPTLVYNLTPEAAATLWHTEEPGAALGELLGHTRASVLECVRIPSSTGEISRRLHISNPSASKHIGVLRRSGLVTTERKNNLALHSLTLLGEAVLG
ncbi:hypothetical protein GCM10010218_01440 [Streptomyces mashuensis]|uniref:HTH arsR-type domain-containing protein n=1 Tax=Streptomyces mashuensis TaxID=33904 RepID=A0A919ATJ0_9ACTN|nr:helix-turn-helix domain-containing protein [Streptomyces mashuensis]GHF24597.1 hypothetical protein GCM10010218_01440 [Streptomyces mashuensis]